MKYVSSLELAEELQVSERSVRNYCAQGKIPGAVLDGKTWRIPEKSEKPARKKRMAKASSNLLERLKEEREASLSGGIYHKVQIELTYNSNHIEGSSLSLDQTRYIYETNTIGVQKEAVNVDDIVETANHFRCIDQIIDQAKYMPSEAMIKQLHIILKSGTSDSRKAYFAVGEYKKLVNEVGGKETTAPNQVSLEMKKLLKEYNASKQKSLEDILEFHYRFESIHPFQDGNGRVGRLIMFKECLRNGITPFIIGDDLKGYYYRGLSEWKKEPGYLIDICKTAQDRFSEYMNQFELEI